MFSNVSVREILDSSIESKRLVDQNGREYVELECNLISNHDLSRNFSVFQCTKKESQGCLGKITLHDQSKLAKLIQLHSCRWSYDEASSFCFLRYGDNKFIRTGYHPPVQTWFERWNLLWTIHSETWNIWTHVIGILLSAYCLLNSALNMNDPDYWIWILHDFVSFSMFFSSTVCHWLHICSESWSKNFSSLDHCGVANALFFGNFTWMYYGLRHEASMFHLYVGIMCIILFSKLVISCRNVFAQEFNFKLEQVRRKLLFVQHLIIFVAECQQLITNKRNALFPSECCNFILPTVLCYWIGAITFMMQLPEALWPGKFDTIFNGHQIMHVMILIAFILQRYAFKCLRNM